MKFSSYLLLTAVFAFFVLSGCDSATDSKPVSVTPPVLVSPPDRDTTQSLTPTFKWTGTADKIQIDRSNNTFTDIIQASDVTGNSYAMPSGVLVAGRTYYWRAGITAGSTVYWSSSVYSFRTR